MELTDTIKKNMLDLQFNKYLQYQNTTIIILFTYAIGVAIAFITGQVNYRSPGQMLLVTSISSVAMLVLLLLEYKNCMNNIMKRIKKLNV